MNFNIFSLVGLSEVLDKHLKDLRVYTRLIEQAVDNKEVEILLQKILTEYDRLESLKQVFFNDLPFLDRKEYNLSDIVSNFYHRFSKSSNIKTFVNQIDEEVLLQLEKDSIETALIGIHNSLCIVSGNQQNDILLRKNKKGGEHSIEIIFTTSLDLVNENYQEYPFNNHPAYYKLINKSSFLNAYGILIQHNCSFFVSCKDNQWLFSIVFSYGKEEEKDEYHLYGDETILVVDDDERLWSLFIDNLKSYGYNIILASNGEECVEIYKNNIDNIDLIILDIIMPKMNGYEAFKEIKQYDDNAKVIISSGYAEEQEKKFLEKGAQAFLKKPYPMVKMLEEIRKVFD